MYRRNQIPKPVILWLAMILTSGVFANNVRVENITLTGQNTSDDYTMVQFDISWDNSWRDIINSDAVWVFVKYKGSDGLWQHARLGLNDPDHTAPAGSVIRAANHNDSYAPGVFIFRDANGAGSNDWNNVQLRWNYGLNGVADGDLVNVAVFAIEMVYVPQASFQLGDNSSTYQFYKAMRIPPDYIVSSQGAISIDPLTSGRLWAGGQIDAGTSDPDFPTGYNAFYCMKYEITQEQYVRFLNTLTFTQQLRRTNSISFNYVMSRSSNMIYRNGIRVSDTGSPRYFYCDYNGNENSFEPWDGQNIACNYLSWMDGCAYADWAGLRPMTELEYEKASRGDQTAVAGEFAWGNLNINSAPSPMLNPGWYNELINNPVSTGNASYFSTDGSIDGPLRAGIFAFSSSSREEAGASYYGIMELSGNLWENIVTIGNDDGRAFTGNHGGGGISVNGNANGVASWPGWDGSEVTGASGSGIRGGSFESNATDLRVSDRNLAANGIAERLSTYGFRCVRTAP